MYEIYQRLLDEKGLKNSDVARATGISNMTLSDWKRGVSKPKEDKMRKIAEFFGVTYGYLMGWEDEELMIEVIKDNALSGMSERMKEYAIRLSKLSEQQQEGVFNMIDLFFKKDGKEWLPCLFFCL